MKIGFFVHHPSPYRDETLKSFINTSQKDSVVIYSLEKVADSHKEWDYKSVLDGCFRYFNNSLVLPLFGRLSIEVLQILNKEKFDIICVSGHYPITMAVIILYAIQNKIPYVYCCDTIHTTRTDFFKKLMYKKAGAIWTTGARAVEHFKSQGVPENKLFSGYYSYDNDNILHEIQKNSEIKKADYVIEDGKVFLFIGKLIKTRNITTLLNACDILLSHNKKFSVIIIGDGVDSEKVAQYCAHNRNIFYIKQVRYEKIHQYYNIADCYVHPGSEPYSLALYEAAIAGLPIISNFNVGAVADVVVDDYNGCIFDGTAEQLAEKMEKVLGDKTFFDDHAKDVQKDIVKNRSVDWAAKQLHEAIMKGIESNK